MLLTFITYFETNTCSLFLILVIETFGVPLMVVLFMGLPENLGWRMGPNFRWQQLAQKPEQGKRRLVCSAAPPISP